VIVKLKQFLKGTAVALGATAGEQHMLSVHRGVAQGSISPGSCIVLDFDGITGVNASYIKATALWILTCGQLSVTNSVSLASQVPRHEADPRPYDLYVCVTGLAPDLEVEFQEFLRPRHLPLLCAHRLNDESIEEAKLLGHLDPMLVLTLKAAGKHGTVTAPELYRASPHEGVTVTAWNNRLNDLHALRLVRRIRAGRAWKYQPLAKRIVWESHS
jgi:hypothetical protein